MRALTLTSLSDGGWLAGRMLRAAKSPRLQLWLACVGMALPALLTVDMAWRGDLGTNALETLIRVPGNWALVWLLAALAIGPLRRACVALAIVCRWSHGKRLSDWNWLIRLRRPLGLACFFYAATHLAIYVALDLDYNWQEFVVELGSKPYIGVGAATFALLLPLAITSTDGWMRRLKRNWKRLHTLTYPAAILAVAHFLLLSKPGVTEPLVYAAVLACLLVWRLVERQSDKPAQSDSIDGAIPERPAKPMSEDKAQTSDSA